ncbi:MAG: hypothetical protein LBS19_08425 [Clostridiales bacterium]|jgi:hypothetical protein|nr:hypothetical protein [Clostridiales bacterium]
MALINFKDYADYEDYLHERYIYDALEKSKAELEEILALPDPFAKLHNADEVHDEMRRMLEERGL